MEKKLAACEPTTNFISIVPLSTRRIVKMFGYLMIVLLMCIYIGNIQAQSTRTAANATTSAQPKYTSRNITIQKGDTLASIFISNKINSQDLITLLGMHNIQKNLTYIKAGEELQYTVDNNNNLQALSYPISDTQLFEIARTKDGFSTRVTQQQIITKARRRSITLSAKESLYSLGSAAGIPSNILLEFANTFSWNVDFDKEVKPGDTFSFLYETKYVGDKFVGYGNLLAAECDVAGHTYKAIRFTDKSGRTAFYSPDGKSLQRAFIRSPVNYTRVSSPFNLQRRHPILKDVVRPHEGVDLAAPRNTPVHAAADGTVAFVGRYGGYGNLVILDNGRGITTRYAHLNKFARGINRGTHVKQGQVIAFVGSTGLANGPHLHYEFRVDGTPNNPLTVKLPEAYSVPASSRFAFKNETAIYLAQLDKPWPTQYALKADGRQHS